jgi:hypothetical protein
LSESSLRAEVSATASLKYRDQATAQSILEAITPDNTEASQGTSIRAHVEDATLLITVNCTRGVGSLLATLDDLISCIQSAETALERIKK